VAINILPAFGMTTLMATILIFAANLCCVPMIAASLSPMVGYLPVSVRCRLGGRQIFLRQLLIF
jgi:hypothetical protein